MIAESWTHAHTAGLTFVLVKLVALIEKVIEAWKARGEAPVHVSVCPHCQEKKP